MYGTRTNALASLAVFGASIVLLASLAGPAAALHPRGIVGHCSLGSAKAEPAYQAYDPVNHEVYVAEPGTHAIAVVKSTCTLSATISLPSGSGVYGIAFDPQNNYVYATAFMLDEVYVISGTTILATLTGFSGPFDVAYDPGDGIMLVSDSHSDNLTAISGTTVFGSIAVGSWPAGITYDPYYSTLLVANYFGGNVTVINATFPLLAGGHGSVGVGSNPVSIAHDFQNDLDYVANNGSDNVSVIYGDGRLYSTVTLTTGSGPFDIAFSQAALSVYVANFGTGTVWKISGLTVTRTVSLGATSHPAGLCYDPVNNRVYVGADATGVEYVLA